MKPGSFIRYFVSVRGDDILREVYEAQKRKQYDINSFISEADRKGVERGRAAEKYGLDYDIDRIDEEVQEQMK